MRNYPMDEATVKRLARPFEELVVRLLETQYSHAPLASVTAASHDGGFDGVVKLGIVASENVEHLGLVEAKLRSSRELELAAIGKSVVVAFNLSANALFLATNRTFAPQALKQLALFQWKTNLRVVLLDGGVLSAWVRRRRAELADFEPELLDFIAEAEPRATPVLEFIDPDDETPIQSFVSTLAKLPRYEFETGWDGDELAPNELRPTSDVRAEPPLPPMIGDSRRHAVARLAGLLELERGIALVSGAAGQGKSLFIRYLRRELARRGMASTLVSMTGVTTRRMYFLRVLAALTGANVEAIASDKGPEGLDAFLTSFSDEGHPSEREAVAAVLASNARDPFVDKGDIHIAVITRYLQKIARRAKRSHVLLYENLEQSTREVLEIVRITSRELVEADVSTVFEARRFGEAATAAESADIDEQRLSVEEWGVVRGAIEAAVTLDRVELDDLTDDEAVALVDSLWPKFGRERAQVVLRAVGNRPLFIETALNWLQATNAVEGRHAGRVIRDLEVFFEQISPSRISLLFEKHLNLWRRSFERVFAAASLLDGQIPLGALPLLEPRGDGEATSARLLATRLFELDTGTDTLHVTHPKIADALERMFGAGRHLGTAASRRLATAVTLRDVARSLLPHVGQLLEPERARTRAPYLLAAAAQWPEALRAATDTIRVESDRREWANVSTIAAFALIAAQHAGLSETERNDTHLSLLLTLTDAERHRGRGALDVNAPHIAELETRVRMTPAKATAAGRRTLVVRALLLAADHHYAREEFEAALQAAVDAENVAVSSRGEIGEEASTAESVGVSQLKEQQ